MSQVFLTPYDDDALADLARRLVAAEQAHLPDLTHVIVFLPDNLAAGRLRALLLNIARAQFGQQGLLGPHIHTLTEWVSRSVPPNLPVLGTESRALLLAQTIQLHANFLPHANPWALADALLDFFDELTAHRVPVSPNFDEFLAHMTLAYGPTSSYYAALGVEARVIHTLWIAWHEQLAAHERADPGFDYAARLASLSENAPDSRRFYAVGFVTLSPPEQEWFKHLLAHGALTLILHGQAHDKNFHPDTPLVKLTHALGIDSSNANSTSSYSKFFDSVFDDGQTPLILRAKQQLYRMPVSPVRSRLRSLAAHSFEDEARAVEVQTRRWLQSGVHPVGLVIEDRQLARRVRALLERSGIAVVDRAGWALSTTSAAAAVETWLQTIEEDFAYRPLLDTLKSPFTLPNTDRAEHLRHVYRLHNDIIVNENIARGLDRYRRACVARGHRMGLTDATRETGDAGILSVLGAVEHAAEPLVSIRVQSLSRPRQYVFALQQSLQRLGVQHALENDAAGRGLLDVLDNLVTEPIAEEAWLDWQGFRTWLGRALERKTFHPQGAPDKRVELLSLAQSALLRFEGLIIGGASRDTLPGRPSETPFFNDSVRMELGLPPRVENLSVRFHQFRQLLHAAPRVLVSWHAAEHVSQPSPWIELIESFHQLSYGVTLRDNELLFQATSEHTLIAACEHVLPQPPIAQAPHVSARLFPDKISATDHQHLIDCPYKFFAGVILKLRAPDAVREVLERGDYGERVHRCLHAFHVGVDGLPGPFMLPLTTENRAAAINMLRIISRAVFAADVEDNFQHRGLLHQWESRLPGYIDWQNKRSPTWHVAEAELRVDTAYDGVHRCSGRLDRLDSDGTSVAIVDYKTGHIPSNREINTGEAVQLPHYALALNNPTVTRAEYMDLGVARPKEKGTLEGEDLNHLTTDIRERLVEMTRLIKGGHPLTAWGDQATCNRCSLTGICRRRVTTGV